MMRGGGGRSDLRQASGYTAAVVRRPHYSGHWRKQDYHHYPGLGLASPVPGVRSNYNFTNIHTRENCKITRHVTSALFCDWDGR